MKTGFEKETGVRRGNGFVVAVVFALCLGLGVTGTLLWRQDQPEPPIAVASLPVLDSPELPELAGLPGLASARIPMPAASVTEGMSARQAALTLGNWYYDHHQHELAVKNFRRAVELGVTHPNVRTDLGNALRLNGQPQDALKQYQIAQKQDPTHEPSLFNQGALYATDLKNPRKGVEVWRLYGRRFPKGAQAAQARRLIAKFGGK